MPPFPKGTAPAQAIKANRLHALERVLKDPERRAKALAACRLGLERGEITPAELGLERSPDGEAA